MNAANESDLCCGRCGLPAVTLLTSTCPRCGSDVREVGIGPRAGTRSGPAGAIARWTFLLAIPVIAILITLESVKYYQRNQQRMLMPVQRGGLSATFTATGSGFSKTCPLDDVTILLVGPGGQRTILSVDAGNLRYRTPDDRLELRDRPGRLTTGVMLIVISSIGVNPTDPANKAIADELMGVIAGAHAGNLVAASCPSFKIRGGGGAGYSGGANRTLVNWTLGVGVIVWIAGVATILRRERRPRGAAVANIAEAGA
ncbi:MAG: hypothetical protein ABIP55_16185 [Tepidisphaeraceae bacterium]